MIKQAVAGFCSIGSLCKSGVYANILVVMTVGSQSEQSQIESYG